MKDITVIDISRLLPGGFASLLLARLGARVIKIEEPGVGDYYRALNPPFTLGQFKSVNAGKLLVSLNLKTPEGVGILSKLVHKADVVIENFRPGTLTRLGIGYKRMRRWNRRIILCSITGRGQRGKGLAGHDLNFMAESGLLSLNRDRSGEPMVPDFQLVDLSAGFEAVLKILVAIQKKPKGGWIDCAMSEVARGIVSLYAHGPEISPLKGLRNYEVYPSGDGRHVAFAGLEPKFMDRLGEVISGPVPIDREGMARLFKGRSFKEWTELGERHDFCLSPVLLPQEVVQPDLAPHPPIGRDNEKVYRSIGLSRVRIRDLSQKGIL